jgi:DNA-nicking Smr family endonuclease
MAIFQPGDKVKYLHGTESGTVVACLSNGLVRVEVDGFDLEYVADDLVHDGSQAQRSAPVAPEVTKVLKTEVKTPAAPGIWLACAGADDTTDLGLYVMNYTAHSIFLQLFAHTPNSGIQLFRHLQINAGALTYLFDFKPPVLGKGKEWHFQIVPLPESGKPPGQMMEVVYRARPLDFKHVVFSSEVSFIYSLTDAFQAMMQQDTEETAVSTFSNKLYAPDRVDLHAEHIESVTDEMLPAEILTCQFEHFVYCLDNAIAMGKKKITFIHGIGDGILKDRMYKYLGTHPHVDYYELADKHKGGAGATVVVLKK